MGKLDGKVAIVTGAARGLGRAYAKRLAGLGRRSQSSTSISNLTGSSKPKRKT